MPTSTSTFDRDSESEEDENFFSSDSDDVYGPEGEDYQSYGDRRADDNQLPFGFVKTYRSLALIGFADFLAIYLWNTMICNRDGLTNPYFRSLKG